MSLLQQSQTLGHPGKAAKSGLLLGERHLGTASTVHYIICAAHDEPLNQILIVSPTVFWVKF
jgi:hypothetical protein